MGGRGWGTQTWTTHGEVCVQSARTEMLGVRLSWAGVSDPGLVRGTNEDAILAEPGWYVVADGMGGHAAGEVASGITIDTLRDRAQLGAETQESGIPHALERAHQAVRDVAGTDRVIGSTVTGLALSAFADQPTWLVWNIGDSRCYRIIGDELEQITRDHTVVAELMASGALTAEQASQHPERHVITRAVGADDTLQADYWMLAPVAGERFLLCSDGLTNEVSDHEIRSTLVGAGSPSAAAISLLAMALERGGHDNVSAVVVFNQPTGTAPDGPLVGSEVDDTAPRPTRAARPSDRSTASADPPRPSDDHAPSMNHGSTLISEVPG